MKSQNFFQEDWDYAIILDSARYDVFKQIYADYFEGDLEKRESKASATPEWVEKVFEGRQNINWFSTNPFVNGKNIPLNQFEPNPDSYETNPSQHITNVVDLWDDSWNSELGTIRPEKVNEEFRDRIDDFSDRRTVIHYIQPHKPYVGRGSSRMENMKISSFDKLDRGERGIISRKVASKLPDVFSKLEDSETAMKLGLISCLDTSSLLEVLTNDTRETLLGYHEENMRLAMAAVRDLVEDLDGKIVITSDHGEAFGEEGVWEHHIETHIPPLVEVPWLEVEGVKN